MTISRENKFRLNMAAIAVFLLAGIIWLSFGVHTVEKDSAYLQALTDKALPKTSHDITISKATIHLADGKATITVNVEGKKLGRHFDLIAEGVGVPDYRSSKKGDVYFKPENVEVTHFSYDHKPPSLITSAIASRSTKFKELVELRNEKIEEWVSVAARRGAIEWLERMPVYRLNTDTNLGFYAHAALLDHGAKINGDKLALKFSFWQFSAMVIGGFFLLVIVVAIAFAAPEAFLVFFFWLD